MPRGYDRPDEPWGAESGLESVDRIDRTDVGCVVKTPSLARCNKPLGLCMLAVLIASRRPSLSAERGCTGMEGYGEESCASALDVSHH